MELKEEMVKTIQELPDGATFDEAIERLYLMYKVKKGIQQSESGQLVSQAEARKRMAQWLQ